MKRFELKVFYGKLLMYRSIFHFTPEQEKAYLQEILAKKNYGAHMMDADFEVAIPLSIGTKKFEREFAEKWSKMQLKEYVENYPDITIATALMSCMYEIGWPNEEVEFGLSKGVVQEKLENRFGTFSWKCKRIE